MFQGDTLSPFIFLVAFNPVIQSVQIPPPPSAEYTTKRPPNYSPTKRPFLLLIQTDTSLLVDEPDSNEPPRQYLANCTPLP